MEHKRKRKKVRGIVNPIMEQLVDRGSFTSFDVQERALREDATLLIASVDREKRRWNAEHGYPVAYDHRTGEYKPTQSDCWRQAGLFEQ